MASDILNGSTNKALLSMSVPISIGMLSTFLFQVIDTYFVGQLGANELAALSFASTVYFLLVGLFVGLSVGISTIIGMSTGTGDGEKVKRTTLLAIILTLFISKKNIDSGSCLWCCWAYRDLITNWGTRRKHSSNTIYSSKPGRKKTFTDFTLLLLPSLTVCNCLSIH